MRRAAEGEALSTLDGVARKLGVRCELEHIMFGSMRFRGSDGGWTTGPTVKYVMGQ